MASSSTLSPDGRLWNAVLDLADRIPTGLSESKIKRREANVLARMHQALGDGANPNAKGQHSKAPIAWLLVDAFGQIVHREALDLLVKHGAVITDDNLLDVIDNGKTERALWAISICDVSDPVFMVEAAVSPIADRIIPALAARGVNLATALSGNANVLHFLAMSRFDVSIELIDFCLDKGARPEVASGETPFDVVLEQSSNKEVFERAITSFELCSQTAPSNLAPARRTL